MKKWKNEKIENTFKKMGTKTLNFFLSKKKNDKKNVFFLTF